MNCSECEKKEAATLDDLLQELWLRKRNAGQIEWTTKDGKRIPIKDMTDSHLENAIKHMVLKKEYDEIAAEYSAYIDRMFD